MMPMLAQTFYRIQEHLLGRPTFRILRELRQSQFWPRHRIQALRLDRLRGLLASAYEHTPYWRELMDRVGVAPQDVRSLEDIKRRIMLWAKDNRPELIGHTEMPAMHWFTPRKARRMLRAAGFVAVYDRWDLARPDDRRLAVRLALGLIRSCFVTKFLANVVVSGCAYAAVKGGGGSAPAGQSTQGGRR